MKKELKKGFTLIELMVVMAIIAVLAVLIIGAIQLARKTAIESVHRGNAKTIQTGLEGAYAKSKSYPVNDTAVSFDSLKATLGVTLTKTTECDGLGAAGGGTVISGGWGYKIVPYDAACTAALGDDDNLQVGTTP